VLVRKVRAAGVDDLPGWVDVERGEDVAFGGGEIGALAQRAGRAFERADVQLLEVFA
jgi:hypothetical protein